MTGKLLNFGPLGLAALGITLLPAAAHSRPMVAEDLLNIKQVTDISISPDGQNIAVEITALPNMADGEKNSAAITQLKLANAPNKARGFLSNDMDISDVSFSPDGQMIGFLWKDDGEGAKKALYAIPVGGGGHQKLVGLDDADITAFIWGKTQGTAYLTATPKKDTAREAERKGGFDAIIYEEEARFDQLLLAENIGRKNTRTSPINISGQPGDMRLSPDGTRMAVAIAPSTRVDDSLTSTRLHILDLNNSKRPIIVPTPGKIDDFEFSPDGKQLSLIAAIDKHDPAATTLHIVDSASGNYRALNSGAAEAVMDTEWTADGRLAAIIHKGVQSELRFYAADGTLNETVDAGALILRSIDQENGKIAVTADAPGHPQELFSLSGNQFTRWTNNNPWLAGIDLGKQRAFTYSARDGQRIEGVLVEPVGGNQKGGAPTIFDVHGGPEAHESNGWITNYGGPGQIAAGKGYAVFLPNYRGSTAYGTAFSKQHQNDYAGKEFNDLVDAIAPLSESGIADKKRVGITGGSYGGYASAWGATALSKYFTASVMFVGISNQISKFGTTDIPQEMFLVHSRKWPWENWDTMLKASPIYHVDKADTPILILHGAKDTRVAPSQSYELYRNLKLRKPDLPSRLILFPGEGHGNRKAAARYDYNRRMMRWFETYLKPGKRRGALPPTRFTLPDGFSDALESKKDK